jgi:hypothetical protein
MMLAGCRSDLEERAVERSVRLPEDPADVLAIGR